MSILVQYIPYSRKYWRELDLAVGPKRAIAKMLADLNSAVQYKINIRIKYDTQVRKFYNLAVVKADCQVNSPPNFQAVR